MQKKPRQFGSLGGSVVALCAAFVPPAVAADEGDDSNAKARLSALQQQMAAQTERLETLKRALAREESNLSDIRRALSAEVLATQRGKGTPPEEAAAAVPVPGSAVVQAAAAVGQAPEGDRGVAVAPIFEQPGVLTPRGKFVFEPSLQYSYSSSNRVALVGYTIIPAVHIGVIDVREVKRNTYTATLTGRYGLTNRLELEARLPVVHRADTTVGRELAPTSVPTTLDADGSGIGDVEFTGRMQLNNGGADSPYFVGSLRVKTRTGKDPFEVETATSIEGLREGVQLELPTGSGFYGIQPAITMLYPSDPAVFFGSVSYLHSFKRNHVTRHTTEGTEDLGTIEPGGVFGFNFGMGLALNERSSFSIGYDHSSVGKTKQNGQPTQAAVRVQLGTLLLGYAYRLNPQRSLNISLGAGLTRDTPDVTLTVRMPVTL